jgi:RNA polymerase sigma-70 factor (ECF subfamily)
MSTGFVGPNELRKSSKEYVNFEARWAMAAKAGYTLAFEELVTRNENRIYRLALNITQNQQDAEDLLHGTFVEAQEHLEEFRGATSFSAWLVQICTRKTLQKLRVKGLNWIGLDESMESEDDLVPNEITDWGNCPEQYYEQTELDRILSEAIGKLNLIHRLVFHLRDVEKLSTVETADLLGLSVSGTRLHLLRARLDVREYLNCYFSLNVPAESDCAGPAEAGRVGRARAIAKTAVA